MSKTIKTLGKIAGGIIAVSAAVGVVAGVVDQIDQAKERRETDFAGREYRHMGPYERFVKRPLDAFLSTGALIVFSPIMATTALLVRLKLGSPVFFTQERPGKIDQATGKEKIFKLYKFRSMTDAKDENGNLLPDEERLTKFGKTLRSTSLDELPELFSIIKGDMAVIGPRPLLVKYLDRYTPEQHRRHLVRPGLTGLAMSRVRNSAGWDKKFELDLKYVDNVSFLLDVKIIFWTIKIVLERKGIDEPGNATNSEFMGTLANEGVEN